MNRRSFLLGLTASAVAGCRGVHSPAEARGLRVLTYNAHHGEGGDGRLDLERIARVICEAKPDLVALQEVDRKARRTGVVDQPAEYERLTGMHACFGAAMPFQDGEYGQVLLSRWPMREWRVVRLPGTVGREPRIAVTSLVDVPGVGRIHWAGVHLDATGNDADRLDQVIALQKEFGTGRVPTLLAGDFNATPKSRVMERMLQRTTGWVDTAGEDAAPTIPAQSPRSRIDYILAWPQEAWQRLQSQVLPEPTASDHRPVFAVLRRV